MILALEASQPAAGHLAKFVPKEKLRDVFTRRLVPVSFLKLAVSIMSMKNLSVQFYIEGITANAEVLEIAAGKIEAVLFGSLFFRDKVSVFIFYGARINGGSGHHLIGFYDISNVQSFHRRDGIAGVNVVFLVITSPDLHSR